MALRPPSMKRFYLAVPRRFEDEVVEELGKLGVVHLTRERAEIGLETPEIDIYERYLRLTERIRHILESIDEIKGRIHEAKKEEKRGLLKVFSEYFGKPIIVKRPATRLTFDEIKGFLGTYEGITDKLSARLDEFERRIEKLLNLKEQIGYLAQYNIRLDEIGDFTHIFVRVGIMNVAYYPKFEEYMRELKVVYRSSPAGRRETLIVIAGSNEHKIHVEKALTLLNVTQIRPHKDLPPDPKEALKKVNELLVEELRNLDELRKEVSDIERKIAIGERYVRFMRDAKSSLMRTKTLSFIQGWIPTKMADTLEKCVANLTGKVMYIKFENPRPGEAVPTPFHHKGLLDKYMLLTKLQGIPNYYEINPTPIYALLFTIMYGMMFGDIGEGAILLVLGLLFMNIKKPFLGLSPAALRRLGGIIVFSSISAIVFGILYGEFFLTEAFEPILFSPIHSIYDILAVALVFGVIQLVLGIVLNIINNILSGDKLKAIFGGKGLIGLIYYLSGVMLAISFVTHGMDVGVLGSPENRPFVITAIVMLVLVFFSPAIESILHGEREHISEKIMEGIGEIIETFFSYLTNSISYARLAAFAIAHGALGVSAELLAEIISPSASYIFMNILGTLVEGFAAGIQSIRLTYYEFSTKFYRGNGLLYSPLKLTLSE